MEMQEVTWTIKNTFTMLVDLWSKLFWWAWTYINISS